MIKYVNDLHTYIENKLLTLLVNPQKPKVPYNDEPHHTFVVDAFRKHLNTFDGVKEKITKDNMFSYLSVWKGELPIDIEIVIEDDELEVK